MSGLIDSSFLVVSLLLAGAPAGEERRFPQAERPPFWKSRVEEIEAAVASVKAGKVQVIAHSPGGRPVQLVDYGERSFARGTANYNSAAAAGDPRYYARKPKDAPPVVMVVGPPHGHEVEGMVGLVNLLQVVETGSDLRGKAWPTLREAVRRSRALIVPVANPDGRARCPYDTFNGIPVDEMTRVGQGTRKDGTLYGWPGVKQRHPMKDDVGLLGAYFNDAGVNLMHDEFLAPMAEETRALLQTARDEAPDYIIILHSHGQPPAILPTAYVPRTQKDTAARFAARLMERYRKAGLPAGEAPRPAEDGEKYPPPSFNLTSALHHVCGGVAMLFECPHGLKEPQFPQVTHDQILDLELILLEELFTFALEEPRPAMPDPPRSAAVFPGFPGLAAAAGALILGAGEAAAPGTSDEEWWSDKVPKVPGSKAHYVGPEGKAANPGTRESPWDLSSTLSGRAEIAPGDVIWVLGGVYRGAFEARLAGKEGAPIHLRTVPGERASILDSGMAVIEPASWLWIWDLEIAGSLPVEKRETKQEGSNPTDLPMAGGLHINAGKGCKFIDINVHDNVGGGVAWWAGSTDGEMYGCVITGNGWRAPDRGHGHCIYTQNKDGLKTISSCILSAPHDGSYTLHAYGSSQAYVDNYLIEENIAYGKGPFLLGGGRPSHGIRVIDNLLYQVDLRLGYGAESEDCEVRGNILAGGKLTIEKFKKVVEKDNLKGLPHNQARIYQLPNRYDPSRANLVIWNGGRAPEIQAAGAPFLKPGDRFQLLDPQDLWGKPVLEGKLRGDSIAVPMTGEFAVFVLKKRRP